MKCLREDVGAKARVLGKIVKSQMKDERLPLRKRKKGSCRKRGRPQLRWENKSRKGRGGEKGRENGGGNGKITKVDIQQSDE